MKQYTDFKSEKYGLFSIERLQRGAVIWWDFYDEHEGAPLTPGFEVWMKECDITDFSDMPKYGIFDSYEEAYDYIIKKFGKIR
jgi:hypothetical protein